MRCVPSKFVELRTGSLTPVGVTECSHGLREAEPVKLLAQTIHPEGVEEFRRPFRASW